jgi:hypothetical protein
LSITRNSAAAAAADKDEDDDDDADDDDEEEEEEEEEEEDEDEEGDEEEDEDEDAPRSVLLFSAATLSFLAACSALRSSADNSSSRAIGTSPILCCLLPSSAGRMVDGSGHLNPFASRSERCRWIAHPLAV